MNPAFILTFTWLSKASFLSDRLRSLLKSLSKSATPLGFKGLPDDLYCAADLLAQGPDPIEFTLVNQVSGFVAPVTLRVHHPGSTHVCSLEVAADTFTFDLLRNQPGLSLLVAGSRILPASQATMEASRLFAEQAASTIDSGRPQAVHRIALWTAPNIAVASEDLILLDEQWDGARLWLKPPVPDSLLQQAALQIMPSFAETASGPRAAAPFTRMLEQALASSDWRTRTIAMLAAVRGNLTCLALPIRQMEIPDTSVPGVDNELRHMLLAMRKASLLLLGGVSIPALEATAPDTRPGMQAHLLRLVAGRQVAFDDPFSTLVQSLIPPPEPLT